MAQCMYVSLFRNHCVPFILILWVKLKKKAKRMSVLKPGIRIIVLLFEFI
jgi:hypothetical protein